MVLAFLICLTASVSQSIQPHRILYHNVSKYTLLQLGLSSFHLTEAEIFQRKLDETTKLLRELQDAQNERLSTKPPPNMICLLGPSYREMHLGKYTFFWSFLLN